MTQYIVSTSPIASQTFYATIGNQRVMFWLRQLYDAMYCDAKIGENYLFAGFRCENRCNFLIIEGCPIQGSLYFIDTQGKENPNYKELGSRFLLVYEE